MFELKYLGSIIAIFTLQGGLLIAAAKSMFATKNELKDILKHMTDEGVRLDRRLYDDHGLPIYMLKTEYTNFAKDAEKRNDILQVNLCDQISKLSRLVEKMRSAQETMNIAISQLQVRNRRKEDDYENNM